MESRLKNVKQRLAKKLTFEEGLTELIEIVRFHYPADYDSEREEIFEMTKRVATLLQSRFTNIGFWKKGLTLFQAVLSKAVDRNQTFYLQNLVSKARLEISSVDPGEAGQPSNENMIPESSDSQHTTFLFEGQLSHGGSHPVPSWLLAQRAQFSLMTEVAEEQARQRESVPESNGTLQNEATNVDDQPAQSGIEVDTNEADETRSYRRRLVMALARLQGREEEVHETVAGMDFEQALRAAMLSGSGADFPGLQEALEATMQAAPKGNPPASKEVVANLSLMQVSEKWLESLSGDQNCSVCQEEFTVAETLKLMPCKHPFHIDCIGAWLEVNNSCPLCRLELLTDDKEYEDRKEREKIEQEERRGVENALQMNEHMFM